MPLVRPYPAGMPALLRFARCGAVLLAVAALPLVGCSGEKKMKAAGKGDAAKAKTDDDASAVDDDTSDSGDELSLEQVLKQCGVSAEDLEDKDKVLYEKTIKSYPKVFTGQAAAPIVGNVNYRVAVTTVISIKATAGSSEQTVDFEIEATPSKAEGPAREKTAPNRGTTKSTGLTTDERSELIGSNKDWDGIFCTLLPVKELSTNKGGKGKIIKFDPPLPGSLSPKADPARYAAEIGEGKSFSGIKAKVVSSSDDGLSKGDSFEGTMKITKVSPTLTIKIGNAGTDTVTADAAYKLEWDFGSVEDTVKLGLVPTQTVYISHEDRDMKAIVADTGFEEGGIQVLVVK